MPGQRTATALAAAEQGGALAAGVVTAVFVSISLVGFLHILFLPVGTGGIVLSFSCIVALLLLQLLWYARGSAPLRSRLGYGILAAQVGLVYLPILFLGQAWMGMPGFLAGSVLLVLRPVAAWTAFTLVVVSMGVAQSVYTGLPLDMLYTALATVTTGLVVYGLSRLTTLVAEVRSSRAEIARMAVLRERLRFARDLHDLLGYSLSAITLKIELTHRLMAKAPREASDQLLEVLEISRLALSDARTVANGYRQLSLEEECHSVASVLAAADISLRLDSDHLDLPVQVSTVLATVLREGVTNLLRHSKARHCLITVRQTHDDAWIEIVNDAPTPGEAERSCGGGLHNLSERVEEIGGAITAAREPNRFRLRAEVPLRHDRHAALRFAADHAARPASEPAGLAGDPDRVDPVAGGELADDRGQVVPDGADR